MARVSRVLLAAGAGAAPAMELDVLALASGAVALAAAPGADSALGGGAPGPALLAQVQLWALAGAAPPPRPPSILTGHVSSLPSTNWTRLVPRPY